MMPDAAQIYAAIDGTWPAATTVEAGPWVLREGRGGGQRVSAATARGPWCEDDLAAAETAMRMMDQQPLFMIRPEDRALDAVLETRGYVIKDPVRIWLCPVSQLTDQKVPPVTAFAIWEPLAIMREIWAAGGIGEARLRVMARAKGPKTGLFGRVSDKPAATGFCAIHDGIALVHALEIAQAQRRKGLGRWMMRRAAFWAEQNGADWIGALCTTANAGANGLYASLNMKDMGGYHYRILPEESDET